MWTYRKGTGYVPSNLLYDGLLYLTNDGGVITCLDARTGEVVYEGGRLPIRGRYSASMVGGGGRILMVNTDGDISDHARRQRTHEVLGTLLARRVGVGHARDRRRPALRAHPRTPVRARSG